MVRDAYLEYGSSLKIHMRRKIVEKEIVTKIGINRIHGYKLTNN